MKEWIISILRHRVFQPFWTGLHRRVLVVMNFWSGDVTTTGEIDAVRLIGRRVVRDHKGAIAFDVGANVGEYSDICLANLPDDWIVHAFEPSPTTFRMLIQRLASVANDRLRVHNLGFSDSERQATLFSSEAGSTIASIERLDRPIREFKDEYSETVRLTTIDSFCATEGIEFIDLLKLDIEGHELSALQGASRMLEEGRIRFLQFEFSENNISSRTYMADFVKLLSDRYSIFRIVPGGLAPWTYNGGAAEIFATMNYLCELRDEVPRASKR